MVSKKINHPLRTIELTYNELKPFHPFEEEMLGRYTDLHNFVKQLYEEYNKVQTKFEHHDRNIKRVVERFKAIKGRMSHLETGAKKILNSMLPDKAAAEKVLQEAGEFKILVKSFHHDVEALAKESSNMQQIFAPLDHMDERFSEIFSEYKEFREELYDNSDNYSLDIERYDTDEREFIASLKNMSVKQNEFVIVCNNVIDRYNLLIEEVEKTYEQWEHCNDMIEMMRLLMVTPYDLTMICLN
jgi:DNA repair ATPase RecN